MELGHGNKVRAIAAILNILCHYHPACWIPSRLLDPTNNPPSSFPTKMPSWGTPISTTLAAQDSITCVKVGRHFAVVTFLVFAFLLY